MIKTLIKRWLGINVIQRKQKMMNNDIMVIIERQLKFDQQYPLKDMTVIPTSGQIEAINEGESK